MTIGAYRLQSFADINQGVLANPNEYISVALFVSPYLVIYKKTGNDWNELPNAFDQRPNSLTYHTNWSQDGNVLIVAFSGSGLYHFYYRNGDNFIKFTPSGLRTTTRLQTTWTSAFSPDGTELAIMGRDSFTDIDFYGVSGSGSQMTLTYKYSQPWGLRGSITNMEYSPDGNSIALSSFNDGSPANVLSVFDRTPGSPDTWIARTVPTTTLTNGYSCAWDSTSTSIAVSGLPSPFLTVFNKSGATITQNSALPSLPTQQSLDADWNHNGTTLALASATTPFLHIWNRSGGTYTKITGTPNPGASTSAVVWKKDGTGLATARTGTGAGLRVYSRSGNTFTQQVVNQTTTAGGNWVHIGWYSP